MLETTLEVVELRLSLPKDPALRAIAFARIMRAAQAAAIDFAMAYNSGFADGRIDGWSDGCEFGKACASVAGDGKGTE